MVSRRLKDWRNWYLFRKINLEWTSLTRTVTLLIIFSLFTETIIDHQALLWLCLPTFSDCHHLSKHAHRLWLVEGPFNPPMKLQLCKQIYRHLIAQAHLLVRTVAFDRAKGWNPLIDTGQLLGWHLLRWRDKQVGLSQTLEGEGEVSCFYH